MDYERDEQIIYIRDLLFAVLYQWKKILVAALALAVLLGGYVGISGYATVSDPKALDETLEEYRDELEKYETEKTYLEQTIESTERNMLAQKEYMEESVLMRLNPYDFYEATMELYIDTDYQIMPDKTYQDPDVTGTILRAYQSTLGGVQVMEEIGETVGLDQLYLKELVKISTGASGTSDHLITIAVRFSEKEKAQEILALLEGQLEEIQSRITDSIGRHTVSVISKECSQRVDISLGNTQKAEMDRLNSLVSSLESAQKALQNLKKPEENVHSGSGVLKSAVKYGILGAVLGAFLVAVAACVAHVAGKKVYSRRTLENRASVAVIGVLADPGKKDTNPIDRRIRQLEGRASESVDADRLVTAAVRNHCGGVNKLLITGDAGAETCRALAEKLDMKEITLIPCGSLLKDPDAVEALPECDGVLLAEKRGCSEYDNIKRARDLVRRQGKTLVGCVLFE